jgi:hypothetical protein
MTHDSLHYTCVLDYTCLEGNGFPTTFIFPKVPKILLIETLSTLISTGIKINIMAPKKSGQITHLEPKGVELLEAYPQISYKFRDAGCFNFFSTFQGYHEQISMMFAQNFDGFKIVMGKYLIHVTEHSIGTRCMLSIYGERWWKK